MTARGPMDKPDLYVVARILERLWRENAPILKTRLQVASRVNYDVFTRYVDWMFEKGLVRYEDSSGGHEGICLTTKGEEAYKRLVQWMNEVIHGRLR
jgi:predicted transcriptional regulator